MLTGEGGRLLVFIVFVLVVVWPMRFYVLRVCFHIMAPDKVEAVRHGGEDRFEALGDGLRRAG